MQPLGTVHGRQQCLHLGHGVCAAGRFRVEGHQRKGLLTPGRQAQVFQQLRPAQGGQRAQVFVSQAAQLVDGLGGFTHADDPGRVFIAAGEVQRRDLGDAVAVVLVRRAQGHIAAADVGHRHPLHGCRLGRRKNLVPVAQNQHPVGAVLFKPGRKALQRTAHRMGGGQRAGLAGEDGNAGGNGHPVRLDLLHGAAVFRGQMCPGDQQRHVQVVPPGQAADHRPKQAVLRPGAGDDRQCFLLRFHRPSFGLPLRAQGCAKARRTSPSVCSTRYRVSSRIGPSNRLPAVAVKFSGARHRYR